jgi:hypothetical protein
MWKEMTKEENLPLPPCQRILPLHDAFWNVMKHGSDVKTQACQGMSVPLPANSPGAKAYDRMQMNVFADIHKGSQMFRANKDLTTYGDLEHFRNAASHQMTFRKCIIEISKIFLNIAKDRRFWTYDCDTTAAKNKCTCPQFINYSKNNKRCITSNKGDWSVTKTGSFETIDDSNN